MKKLTLIAVLLAAFCFSAHAQKVGYTNVELILVYMPQTQEMEKTLKTMEEKAMERLGVKQNYYQQKALEFMEAQQNGQLTEEQTKIAGQELEKLQVEIQEGMQKAEQYIYKKRIELLTPIQKKMQGAIDAVAKEQGYDYILNNAMGSGIPTILYGKESNDVTEAIASKLGIQTEE